MWLPLWIWVSGIHLIMILGYYYTFLVFCHWYHKKVWIIQKWLMRFFGYELIIRTLTFMHELVHNSWEGVIKNIKTHVKLCPLQICFDLEVTFMEQTICEMRSWGPDEAPRPMVAQMRHSLSGKSQSIGLASEGWNTNSWQFMGMQESSLPGFGQRLQKHKLD